MNATFMHLLLQTLLGAERLPRAFLWRRLHRGPLVSVSHLPDLRAHPALLPLPPHREALHRVLRQPHEDSEERLQVGTAVLCLKNF